MKSQIHHLDQRLKEKYTQFHLPVKMDLIIYTHRHEKELLKVS